MNKKSLIKKDCSSPVIEVGGGSGARIKAGTKIIVSGKTFTLTRPKDIRGWIRKPGKDYFVFLLPDGKAVASENQNEHRSGRLIGGFHVDLKNQILSNSIWDIKFRPACPDPTGMVLIDGKFWCDIYLMGRDGKSRSEVEIADGCDFTPLMPKQFRSDDAPEHITNLNWYTASLIAQSLGKQLLTAEEFALAAEGVTEKLATKEKQTLTARFEGLTSKWGLEQATGTLWIWGKEWVDKTYPRLLGGSWDYSGYAGPRFVSGSDPRYSYGIVGARFRCDHLTVA